MDWASDRGARDRSAAFLLSAAVHVALAAIVLWRLSRAPEPVSAPVIDVRLVTLSPGQKASAREQDVRRQTRAQTASHRPRETEAVAPSAPPGPATLDADGGVGQTLRGALVCTEANLDRLTPEERARCFDRFAGDARGRGDGPRLNLDVRGAYARDPEPYLSRRPKNGCKPRAGGSEAPSGHVGSAGGITCAWSF